MRVAIQIQCFQTSLSQACGPNWSMSINSTCMAISVTLGIPWQAFLATFEIAIIHSMCAKSLRKSKSLIPEFCTDWKCQITTKYMVILERLWQLPRVSEMYSFSDTAHISIWQSSASHRECGATVNPTLVPYCRVSHKIYRGFCRKEVITNLKHNET